MRIEKIMTAEQIEKLIYDGVVYEKVVHCCDCAYFIDNKYCDNAYLLNVEPNGYCAWGEKR